MMITSIKCQNCGKVFVYTFHTRKCVCGWEPSEDTKKGIEEVGKRKNKRKKNRKGSNKMGNVPVRTYTAGGSRADSWEVEIDKVHNCDKVPKEQKVLIELLARRKITSLMKKYPSIEWLAYLLGDKEDPYTVKDIYIPKQTVTSASVDNIHCDEFNDLPIIGVIHSHHGMGNGFSGTDHEWINQNHNISLCISKGGIAGQVRMTTPCGALKIIPAIVKVKYPEIDYDFDKWIEEETKKITTKTYTAPAGNYYGNNWRSGDAWHQGQPGIWVNGVFFPNGTPGRKETPSQNGKRQLTESQRKYTTGVAVVPQKENGTPTIDEEMSLAEALTMLSNESHESEEVEVITPTSTEETSDDKKNEAWDSGL